MKVLILWTFQSSYIESAAKQLSMAGHDVTVIYNEEFEAYPRIVNVFPLVSRHFISDRDIPMEVSSDSWEVIYVAGWHKRIYRKFLRRRKGSIRVLYMDNQFVLSVKQRFFLIFSRVFLLNLFDAAFVPGVRQKNYALQLGFPSGRVKCFGVTLESDFFQSKIPKSFSKFSPFIFVGRLAPEKNLKTLLNAYDLYRKEIPNPRNLKIIGSPNGYTIEKTDGVELLGQLSSDLIRNELENSHALILPSTKEPFGVALLEAAAMGLPLVASTAVGSSDHLVNNLNGYSFEALDSIKLKQVLLDLHRCNDEWYTTASSESRRLADEFHPKNWLNHFLDLIDDIRADRFEVSVTKDILFYLAVIPAYRKFAISLLSDCFEDNLSFAASKTSSDRQVRTDFTIGKIRKIAMLKLPFSFIQFGGWMKAITSDVLVLDLNPRSISAWFFLLIRKFKKEHRTLLWGHLYSRTILKSNSSTIRKVMRKLADATILYTYSDYRDAIKQIPGQSCYVAPNSLYPSDCIEIPLDTERNTILYSGRLVQDKKVDLLLKAFAQSELKFAGVQLIVIGDGPMKSHLQNLAKTLGINDVVSFKGQVFSQKVLSEFYSSAFVAVSASYVGLSLTQSLGFGVPMIIPKGEPHSPEIELYDKQKEMYFEKDNSESLANLLCRTHAEKSQFVMEMPKIVDYVREFYSAERMSLGLQSALVGDVQTPQRMGL